MHSLLSSGLNRARVRAAEKLLATSQSKLEVIAAEVGCASVQHFSTPVSQGDR